VSAKNRYRITIASLPDYEEIVAEMYVDDEFVGLVSIDEGDDQPVFEMALDDQSTGRKVPLDLFESVLAEAKLELSRRKKLPDR